MLLREWAKDNLIPTNCPDTYALVNVTRFVFGEFYTVVMDNKASLQFNDLELLLDIMESEFRAERTLVPAMEIAGAIRGSIAQGRNTTLGQAKYRELWVTPTEAAWVKPQGFLPRPAIEVNELAGKVRNAVTMYNLTGEWGIFGKDNL